MGVGVADGGHDAAGVERGDVVERAVLLGGEGALDDAAARPLLPAVEDLDARVDQEVGVLGADVRGREERALEEDARDARADEVLAATLVSLRDGGAGAADVLDGLGERGGNPRRRAGLGEVDARVVDAVGVAVGGRVVVEAVDVGVHEARADDAPREVVDLAAGGLLGPPDELTVRDGEVAALHGCPRKDEPVGLYGKRAHYDSPLENGPGRLPGPSESVGAAPTPRTGGW